MKIQIQKVLLESALLRSQSFLGKDLSNITSQINLVAKDGILTVKATDYEMGIISKIDNLLLIDEGDIIISGAKILSSVKALKSGEIKLEVVKDTLVISQSRSKFKLPLFQATKYPEYPDYSEFNTLSINSVDMIDSLKKISNCIDGNNPKFELTGALIDISNDDITFASTDTKRLSLVSINNSSSDELKLIVPKKAVTEISKLFFEDVEMFYSENAIVILVSNTMFFTKLINGKYPDYQRIVPKDTTYKIELQKMPFLEAIKQIATVSNEIRITFSADRVDFQSITDDNNSAATVVSIDKGIDNEITLCVNSLYVVDFLNTIVDNDFTIGINEDNMPFVLSGSGLKTIVMPIVL